MELYLVLGARKAYAEGKGSVLIRAKTSIETIRQDRSAIVVSEIPYQVNKSNLIEKIADLAKNKRLKEFLIYRMSQIVLVFA